MKAIRLGTALFFALFTPAMTEASEVAPEVTFESLLCEMADLNERATFPAHRYTSLQASSYNWLSTARDQPDQGTVGWFADSDGISFIRSEGISGRTEWVVMEHEGPGALTRFWTPFFYHDFNNRTYPPGTLVTTFTTADLKSPVVNTVGAALAPPNNSPDSRCAPVCPPEPATAS